MIRTLMRLIPDELGAQRLGYSALSIFSVLLRAAAAIVLVPLLSALFAVDFAAAWLWVAVLSVVTIVGWGCDTLLARIGYEIGFTLLNSTQHRITETLSRVPLNWFTAERTAAARQAIAATGPDLVGLVVNLLTPLIGAVLLPLAIAIGLFAVSWTLALAALFAVPALLLALWGSTRMVRSADQLASQANSQLTERIVEFARTQQALRASRQVSSSVSRVGQAVSQQRLALVRLLLFQIPGQFLFSVASQLALLLIAGTILWQFLEGDLNAVAAVAMLVVLVRFLEPFTVLSELSGAIESARGVLSNIRTVIDAPVQHPDAVSSRAQTGPLSAPVIEFRDVTFGYGDGARPVLEGLSFRIPAASSTAIVGPSGSGKSTILGLIAGLHTPQSGEVLIDGIATAHLPEQQRNQLFSMVFQHPYLFAGSIEENIRAGYPDAAETERDEAIRLARVDEILSRLEGGLASQVGEAGAALSGGERQRISIARALLKPAPVLLIDEATSALDTENEAAVTRALTVDVASRTRVIVAHRLSSIRAVDRVLFIEDGLLIEQGTVSELNARGGRFADFWQHQEQSIGWKLST